MRTLGSDDVLELLELLFRHRFNKESHKDLELLLPYGLRVVREVGCYAIRRKDFEVSRWLNAFHIRVQTQVHLPRSLELSFTL